MGLFSQISDRLINIMSGQGTSIDRRTAAAYVFDAMTAEQSEAAYRVSWLVKKLVDIPAKDMTREWRDWQADEAQIELLEKEEKRLKVPHKFRAASIASRVYGGAGIYIGTGDADPMQPLDVEKIGKGGLKYLRVMSPQHLGLGPRRLDLDDEWIDEPEFFQLSASGGRQVKIHPSRIISFVGQKPPEGAIRASVNGWYWGDPVLQAIGDAVKHADTSQAGFAALIDEAKLDILKMPGLTEQAQTTEGETRILNRLSATSVGKSTWRALLLDAEDEWEQRQITWAGIPQIMMTFLEIVCGAADIPVTRFLGQSAKGLASTGDGEERDYHSMVKANQDELLAPALDKLDEVLIRSALGARDEKIHYLFAPLSELSEKDAAEVEKKTADTLKVYADTGLIHEEALAEIARNKMTEGGRWPGCEAAFDAVDNALGSNAETPEQKAEREESERKEASQLMAANENTVGKLQKTGRISAKQADELLTDARPRSLYVQRKLLNGAAFLKWAKEEGFESTVPADELHVTVLYSRAHVDWLKMGSGWESDEKGQLRVPPGGARIVEPLGDKGAVVLLFSSSQLSWRHEEMVRQGASHDFDAYQPHVTITYAGSGVDLDAVEPYRGELLFGPEIFEEVDDDWSKKLVETGSKKKTDVGDSHHWNTQPRDPGGEGGGQWIAGGAANEGTETKGKPLNQAAKDAMAKANEGKDIAQLRLEAATNQQALSQLGQDMQRRLGVTFVEPPAGFEVKTAASIERKVATDMLPGPHYLRDISRASFVVDSPAQAESVIGALAGRGQVFDRGWTREKQSGYLGRFIYVQHPNGGVSEIQLVPQGVAQLKMGENLQSNGVGHQLYEVMRLPSRPIEARQAAARKARSLYSRAMPKAFYKIAGLMEK
jgi:phage-related protein (TIGR01555 family)